MPAKLERCVKELISQGKTEEEAYAICNASITKDNINDTSIPALDKYIDENTGFLHVKGILARTGVQEYMGYELSDDLEPSTLYGVLRHPDDVLSEPSLAGYKNAPVTDDHPDTYVTAENYKELVKGSNSEISIEKKEGIDYIHGNLTIMDEMLIEQLKDGKLEISAGYSSDIVPEEGVFLGEPYSFRQRNIKINHVAIVARGRCGGRCRIVSDRDIIHNEPKSKGDSMKKIVINGVEYEVSEEVYNELMRLNQALEGKEEEAKTMASDMEEAEEEKEKAVATADGLREQLKSMKRNTNDSNIVGAAKKLVEVKSVADSMKIDVKISDEMTMKKEVLAAKYPSLTLDGKSDAYINARFDVMVEGRKSAEESQKQIADNAKTNTGSLVEQLKDKDY